MINNLDFISIDNCIIEADSDLKSSYHYRLKNIGISSDAIKSVSGQNNSYLMIFDKAFNVTVLKNSIRLLRKNSFARNRFIIFDISPRRKFFFLCQCFLICILLRRNPLLFYKYKSKDIVINLLPDSPKIVLGCSGFKSLFLSVRYFIRNILYIYICSSIIIEY